MKIFTMLMLFLASGANLIKPEAETIKVLKAQTIDQGAVTFNSCGSSKSTTFTVKVSHVAGTAPSTLYRFEDGVLKGSLPYNPSGTIFPVTKPSPFGVPSNVTFGFYSGGFYYLYAGANIQPMYGSNCP